MTSNCERDSNLVPSPPGGGLYLCLHLMVYQQFLRNSENSVYDDYMTVDKLPPLSLSTHSSLTMPEPTPGQMLLQKL